MFGSVPSIIIIILLFIYGFIWCGRFDLEDKIFLGIFWIVGIIVGFLVIIFAFSDLLNLEYMAGLFLTEFLGTLVGIGNRKRRKKSI